MKACATLNLAFAVVTTASLAFLACGGGSAGAPPAQAAAPDPAPPAPASAAPEPAATSAAPSESSAPPADSAAADEPEDARSMEVIAAVVKAHRQQARDCYEKALKQVPGLKGDLVIHFTLKPNGKVKEATLNRERSTITEPSVVSCVIDVIKSLEYPRSSKGFESSVNYPFNFNP